MDDYDREEILTYFNNFDSNNNGVLEFSEFAELIKHLGLNIADEQLKDGFNKIDTGNNNMINFDEFMTWWGEQN
jgi:Ca2+-binding EF-hand superfamily protein